MTALLKPISARTPLIRAMEGDSLNLRRSSTPPVKSRPSFNPPLEIIKKRVAASIIPEMIKAFFLKAIKSIFVSPKNRIKFLLNTQFLHWFSCQQEVKDNPGYHDGRK